MLHATLGFGRLAIVAILPWRLPRHAFKHHAHVFRMLESGKTRNFFQREIRRAKQFLAALYLNGSDLCLRRVVEQLAEVAFEPAAGDREMLEELIDRGAIAGALADEP
jgi:hypothetical protein